MAFHGVGTTAARQLFMHDFGSRVDAAAAPPSVALATKAPVVAYLSPYTAEVRGPRGIQDVTSLLPLAHPVDGRERPLDLHLKAGAGGFEPVNGPGLSIARNLSAGVRLGATGIRIAMEGQDVSAAPLTGSSVFFADVGKDLDATVVPTPRGVEFFATLRSRLSSPTLRYRLTLPLGDVLQGTRGGAEVLRDGLVLARIPAPTATDSQGQNVPVTLVVAGDQLVLEVADQEGSYAYPILVDPVVTREVGSKEWVFEQGYFAIGGSFYGRGAFVPTGKGPFVALEPGGIEAPKGVEYTEPEGKEPAATWTWTPASKATITSVVLEYIERYSPEETGPYYTGSIESGCGFTITGPTGYSYGSGSFNTRSTPPSCTTNSASAVYVTLAGHPEGAPGPNRNRATLSVNPLIVTEAARTSSEEYGGENPAVPDVARVSCGKPVNCATGNEFTAHTDMAVGGNPGLGLTRTYNAQLAATQSSPGPFGYGWSASYGAYLTLEESFCERKVGTETERYLCKKLATVHQANGSTVGFEEVAYEQWTPVGVGVQASLFEREPTEPAVFFFTLPGGARMEFSKTGVLVGEYNTDHNATALTYNGSGQLTKVEEPAKRSITFAYNSEGLVKEAKDVQGTVYYTYASKNLTEVTDLDKHVWKYGYNSSHELTSETNPLSHTTSIEYDSSHRVIAEEDPMKHKITWKYATVGSGTETTVTDPTAAVNVELFNASYLPTSITHASGTSIASTTTYEYDPYGDLIAVTDPDKHTTKYEYDSESNRISETDANGNETKWTYNSAHEVVSLTTPKGETTTIKREEDGNPETIERPAPGGTTQTTTYKYGAKKDLESVTDPLGRTWKYEYDGYGDKTAEIDPEGDKRTWSYNEASQETATVSPRGNVTGGEPTKFTNSTERDAEGRPLKLTEPEAGPSKPANRTPATISGTALEGQTLTAGTGIWEASPAPTYGYQWQACNPLGESCYTIPGATAATLALNSEGLGYTFRVIVTATNSSGSAASTSAPTAVASATAPPVYSSSFGSAGGANGEFERPSGLAIDAHGNVWVVDSYNNRIQEFSSSGTWLATYGKYGIGNGEYAEPVAIAINQSTGNVYITDQNNDRVQELNEKGEFVRAFGSYGTGNGQFNEPNGITIDSKGNVWVTDYANDRVQEFNEKGEYLSKFGSSGSGGGEFLGPSGLVLANGYIYVNDLNNSRFEVFSEKGEYLGQGGGAGVGAGGFAYPAGMTANSSGDIYIADLGNGRIQELAQYGEFLTLFGAIGSGAGQLSEPEDIAINSSKEIYITDSGNNRIEKWVPAGKPANMQLPSISGQLRNGETLTAGAGTWAASPVPTYTYQWQRCNASGGECANISGATSATHVLVTADLGDTLRVAVTATNSAGNATATSATTEAVTGARVTEYTYTASGELETVTDPDRHKTKYTYNADSQPTKVEAPNGSVTETEYDADGDLTAQTDGNKHTTKYTRNVLERVTEITEPLGHKTTKEYDAAGNLKALTNPSKQTTTYTYDPGNRLTEVKYSDGKTPTVKYEYDKDGDPTGMTDGTGTTTYTYDQLGRLTEAETGHKEKIKYEYDLANEQTKITYPNGKAVTRAYDKDGRLEKVTDWLEHTTKFSHDPDSNLSAITFPTTSIDEDKYVYNNDDQTTEVKFLKSTETLASLAYTRDNDGQVLTTTSKGLPGSEHSEDAYDTDNRLTKAGSAAYEYDPANNPTKLGSGTYKYNAGDQLESGPSLTYTYNELGQRTKTTPTSGPATTYGYNEAGSLTTVERPKEGEVTKIEDSYSYNGEGLRASQDISGTTSYLTWDTTEELPLILSDGTNSYIYGPAGLPVEQVSNGGTVTYLHHDQQGSTRLVTGTSGASEGEVTYDAYGDETGSTGTATTPLGYDGQYTSSDTGLIYLRARTYDPATAQFLSADPLVAETHAPYSYAGDNPVSAIDPSGLESWFGKLVTAINPIHYFKEEITDYEDGCGYLQSVVHGLEGAVVGALDVSGVGEEAAAADGAEALADTVADDEAEVVRHYTGELGALGIERDASIRTSADGIVYLTTDVYSNGADAQAGLNLDNAPTGYFEIPSDRILGAEGPYPVPGGSGTQILNDGSVDATGLTFIPFE
jgi:RHS repeat-associated protein